MVHAQAAHMVNIYELGVPSLDTCTSPDSFIENNIQDKVRKKLNRLIIII